MKVNVTSSNVTYYSCGKRGQIAREYCQKESIELGQKWCSYHRSSTHCDETCRRKPKNMVESKQTTERLDEDTRNSKNREEAKQWWDFQPQITLHGASGWYKDDQRGVEPRRRSGPPEGKSVMITLKKALFIPTYPQSIISVQAATTDGAKVVFQEGRNELVSKEGTVFRIEYERLYYLRTVSYHKHNSVTDIMSKDKMSLTCDVKIWHEIMGHCNIVDVLKLSEVVEVIPIW